MNVLPYCIPTKKFTISKNTFKVRPCKTGKFSLRPYQNDYGNYRLRRNDYGD